MSIAALPKGSSNEYYHQVRWIPLQPFVHSKGTEYNDPKSFQFPITGSWRAAQCHSSKFGAVVVLNKAQSKDSSKKPQKIKKKAYRAEVAIKGNNRSFREHTESAFQSKHAAHALCCEYWTEAPVISSMIHFANYPAHGTNIYFGMVEQNGEAHILLRDSFKSMTFKNADDPFVRIALSKRSIVLLSRDGVLRSSGYSFDGIRGFKQWPEYSFDAVLQQLKLEDVEDVKFVQVSGGMFHFCALSDSGDVYAWGRNNKCQCAVKSESSSFFSQATKVQGLPEPVISVEAGKYFNLALSKSLKLYVWGGSPKNYEPRIIDLPNNETPLKISANGSIYFAVLTDRGNVYLYSDDFTLIKRLNNETGVSNVGAHIVNISTGHSNLSLVEFHDRHNPKSKTSQENLPKDLLSVLQNSHQSDDVKVKFQDRVFKLHRGILAARSLLFENLFSEEKEEYDVTSYVPSTTTPALFASAIDFIYSATVPRGDKNAIEMISPIIKGLEVRTELGEDVVYNLKQELIRDIGSMITKDEQKAKIFGSDVTFTFKDSDTKLFAHKFILTKRSSYFSAMFNSGLSESHGSIVEMVDVSEQVLQLILNYIYTGKVDSSSITIDNCIEAMITANEYDEQGLCMFIEDQVVRLIDLETVHVLSDLAKRFKFSYLDERCEFFMHCHADVLKHFGNTDGNK